MSQYDAFASDFSQTRQKSWPEFDLLYPLVNKQDRICDLGCGNGRLRKFLEPELIPPGYYYGMDMSAGLLQIAKGEFEKDHFFKGDFTKPLPFGADQFNIVTAVASFHHILDKKKQEHFINECLRILRPGGTLFLTTWILPQKYKWSNYKARRFKNWEVPFGPDKHPRTYRNVTQRELKKRLKKQFKEIQIHKFEGRNLVAIAKKK